MNTNWLTPEFWQLVTNILKFASIFFSAALGMLALFVDFRDKRTNRITVGGRRILWLMIFSMLTSVILQSLEIYQDKLEDIKKEKEFTQVITSLDKTLSPIKDIVFSLGITPDDSSYLLEDYYDRVNRDIKICENKGNCAYDLDELKSLVFIDGESPLFPKVGCSTDLLASQYFKMLNFSVDVYKDNPIRGDTLLRNLTSVFRFEVNGYDERTYKNKQVKMRMFYDDGTFGDHPLRNKIEEISLDLPIKDFDRSLGSIRSLYDLEGTYLIFTFSQGYYEYRLGKIANLLNANKMAWMDIIIDGKALFIGDKLKLLPSKYPNDKIYYYKFPDNLHE